MSFLRKLPRNLGWLLVMAAGLGISAWSLYALGRSLGMPPEVALVVSLAIDGGALVVADTRMAHARDGESGGAARAVMLLALASSVYLNASHALMLHYATRGAVLFSIPALIAGAVFEIKSRHAYRRALREHGRIAPPLPPFGAPAWLMHPLAVLRRIREITLSRIESIPVDALDVPADTLDATAVTLDGVELQAATPPPWTTMTKAAAVDRADQLLKGRTAPQLAAALAEVGVEVTPAAVRTARSRRNTRTTT